MFSTFDVYIAEASDENLERDLLRRFIVTYLTQDELDKLKLILSNLPQLRPFWGKTGYKYITMNNIYFLYEVAEDERKVVILGAKFNNKRKIFNFANTLKQQKAMRKWIEDYPNNLLTRLINAAGFSNEPRSASMACSSNNSTQSANSASSAMSATFFTK